MRLRRFVAGLIVFSTGTLSLFAQNTTDLEKGRQLFLGMCSRCHGASGGGGEGPGLTRLSRAHNDEELTAVIRDGIPDRGMPRVRRFTAVELRQMVGFVHSFGVASGGTGTGNPANGRAVYQKLGCQGCHIVAGEGGDFGPELTNIGARRAYEYLKQSIVNPGASLPRGAAVPGRGLTEYLPVKVVTREGREVNGVRVNEDSFTIQVRDTGGKLYSFRKAEVKQMEKLFGKSLMPDYKDRVVAGELEDLAAYLSGLGTGSSTGGSK